MPSEFSTRADRYNLLKLLLNFCTLEQAPERGEPATAAPIDAGGKGD
jgi:hypothetical protein